MHKNWPQTEKHFDLEINVDQEIVLNNRIERGNSYEVPSLNFEA